jgi:hypothetical protein
MLRREWNSDSQCGYGRHFAVYVFMDTGRRKRTDHYRSGGRDVYYNSDG